METVHKTVLPKNTLTFVEVSTKMNAKMGFFKCKKNNAFMNSNLLLPMNGMFKCDKNRFFVPILNMGDIGKSTLHVINKNHIMNQTK